jgi:predicted alpha/beta-fold hydrolase
MHLPPHIPVAAPPDERSYVPPRWLRNGHAQTIYASCLAPAPQVRFRREQWETPDGDFVELDWTTGRRGTNDAAAPDTPLIVLFHGLEGSSRSHYARTFMHAAGERGWQGVVVHFRGCGGRPNRFARAYHSGDSAEMEWMLERFRRSHRNRIGVVAVSLGGNVLLKWLGEAGPQARRLIDGACAISAPMDLVAAGTALDRGFNRLYTWNFLRTLRRKTALKLRTHAMPIDAGALTRTRTLRGFDDLVTSQLHGFRDAMDYWSRSSSKPGLKNIAVPTLVLNARDDPFLPAWALPDRDAVSDWVTLDFPRHGGHVGFVTGRFPGSLRWLPERVLSFLETQASGHEAARGSVA